MANKILLADDSITIQKVVNLTFTDEGINVVTVGNGELALKKLGEEQFDLVLADIFMPGRNGYEVCEHVKMNPQTHDVPVILLVGAFEPFDKTEAARVRADGHLTKPFESRILIETVKRMLAESAMRTAQATPASNEPAYRGQVVGWDVPTSPMVPQHLDDAEPEPPPYDPYASTAKLPPLHRALGMEETPEPALPEIEIVSDQTMSFGAPLPTGALFTPGAAEAPSDVFEYSDPEPASEVTPIARALDGPPDAVPGFSFRTGPEAGSGPLGDAPAVDPTDRSPIGYQEIPSTDSPLDLPEMDLVEQHTHEPAAVSERRDPLLETFADVAESTARVDASAAPGLEVNTHADGAPSLSVGTTDGIISAWDPQAQPPAAPPPPSDDEAPTVGAAMQTQAFSANDSPFGFSEEPAVEETAPMNVYAIPEAASPFELPSESAPEPAGESDHSPAKPTIGLADLSRLETLRGTNRTERFTDDDVRSLASEEPAAQETWQPHIDDEASAPEVEIVSAGEDASAAFNDEPTEPHDVVTDEAGAAEIVASEAEGLTAVVDEEPPVDTPYLPEEPVAEQSTASEESIEAAAEVHHAEAEAASEDVVADAASTEVAEGGEVAEVVEPASGNGSSPHGAIPADVMDEIVRRTLEKINDDVIREIAWEVVPELAESIIRKRLSEKG